MGSTWRCVEAWVIEIACCRRRFRRRIPSQKSSLRAGSSVFVVNNEAFEKLYVQHRKS